MSFFRLVHPTSDNKEAEGSPKFLMLLSLHATLSDPGSPSGISPLRSLCAGFRHVKTVANCFVALTGLNCLREVRLPCGLQCSLCTLHGHCSSNTSESADRATLGTGCWLGFARWGLPAQQTQTGHPIRSTKLRLAH